MSAGAIVGSAKAMNDGSMDDLPRTLRRERELRERAQREQQQERGGLVSGNVWDQSRGDPAQQSYRLDRPGPGNPYDAPRSLGRAMDPDERIDATVRRIKVPFFSLMGFFIKAVFAAVPALLILIAMLYGLGLVLEMYFPWLIKLKILISFPG